MSKDINLPKYYEDFVKDWWDQAQKYNPILTKPRRKSYEVGLKKKIINSLKRDIANLQASTDIKVLEQTQDERDKWKKDFESLQEAFNTLLKILGKDLKNTKEIKDLLAGKTLKQLLSHHQTELEELDSKWKDYVKQLAEEKDEEIETLIIKNTEAEELTTTQAKQLTENTKLITQQTERIKHDTKTITNLTEELTDQKEKYNNLEALRQDQVKELKKEIDSQQKELIARTQEIWDLEKKQEQTLKQLKETQTQLTTTDNQLKEQTNTNTLYSQKINDLDNQLINLARQKIKSQKEAKELLNQLEANWKKEKASWQQEKTNLITHHQQVQDKQASQLAQERKDFYGQIERLQQVNQELTTNLTEKGKTISNHLSSIKDLEAEIANHKDQAKKLEAKRLAEQEEHTNEKKFWNTEAIKQQELYNQLEKAKSKLEKTNQSLTKSLQEQKEQTNLKEQGIQLKNKKVKEMEEWSKGQHNRIVELEAQAIKEQERMKKEKEQATQLQQQELNKLKAQMVKDKEQMKKDHIKARKEYQTQKDKEVQANKEEVKNQLTQQINQIKKATGLDTITNKFISFESLLEKVKTKLEKGERVEEMEAKIKELEEKSKELGEEELKKWKKTQQKKLDGVKEKIKKIGDLYEEKPQTLDEIYELLKKKKQNEDNEDSDYDLYG